MLLLGALAVLALGSVAASAAPAAEPSPCHASADASGQNGNEPKAAKIMGCCVACVAAPAPCPPDAATSAETPAASGPRLAALPAGEILSPEPHPPRA